MRDYKIPYNKPSMVGDEIAFIQDAVARCQISGDGYYTKKSQKLLEEILEVPKVMLTTSCTDALEMAALLLNIQPGDEVIVPSFTFVSSINAFVLRGARPVFIDIRPDTLNFDETLLERQITQKTKAIVVVHYAGVGCEMDSIMAIADRYGIPVVEDNAHGLFGKYKGKNLGTFGALATLSFHETKNITCGEGGALIINEPNFIERAEIIREKGTNRSRFFRGEIDKYTWVDQGSSHLPSEILAAYLFAQLSSREKIQAQRKQIWDYYQNHIHQIATEYGTGLPFIPEYCAHPFHIYYLLLPSREIRQRLIDHLKDQSIMAISHYLPLHSSLMGTRLSRRQAELQVTDYVSDRLLRLPIYNQLDHSEQKQVIDSIRVFFEQTNKSTTGQAPEVPADNGPSRNNPKHTSPILLELKRLPNEQHIY